MSSPPAPRGVIHDLGYRPFTGRRRSERQVAGSLYLTSLAHCFGIGRSGKAKIVPWLVSAVMLIPALVIAGILVQLKNMSMAERADALGPLTTYIGYPYWTQLLVTIFVAAQAPVLFARDLRYRTIVLYFARPLSRSVLVLTRLAALATAIFAVLAVPMTIWWAVAVSSDQPFGTNTRAFLAAIVAVLLLALTLAAVGGLVAALTTRTGLSVTAIIVTLMVTSGVVTAVLSAVQSTDPTAYQGSAHTSPAAMIAAALNPFSAVAALATGLFDVSSPMDALPSPHGAWVVFFVAVCLAWIVLPTLALLARIRKVASL